MAMIPDTDLVDDYDGFVPAPQETAWQSMPGFVRLAVWRWVISVLAAAFLSALAVVAWIAFPVAFTFIP